MSCLDSVELVFRPLEQDIIPEILDHGAAVRDDAGDVNKE